MAAASSHRSRPAPGSGRWMLIWLAPLLAVVAWPRSAVTETRAELRALAPWRVAYPQVEVLDARRYERLRGRCLDLDARAGDLDDAVLRAQLAGASAQTPVIVHGRLDTPKAALHAALQARVWGHDRAYVVLDR